MEERLLEMHGPGPDFCWVLELPASLRQVMCYSTSHNWLLMYPSPSGNCLEEAVLSSLNTPNALLSTTADGQVAIQTGVFELTELIIRE